jgi:beta-phosphoglucomutase-like phosphatase (HAD superfamily)
MKYQGIIFDFNGVLVWDTHLHEQAWIDFARDVREAPLSVEEVRTHIQGRKNKCILEYLLKRAVTGEELKQLALRKESIYQKLCLENPRDFRLSPGAVDLLEYLVENGIPHTIATASEKVNLDFFIKHLHLGKWFDLSKIVYDNGTFPSKAEMYSQAAKNLNLAPEKCMVIEDSKSGIQGAVVAGIGKIVALGSKEMLKVEGVNQVISSLEEILELAR